MIMDGAPGGRKQDVAVAFRQRCQVHKMRIILSKPPNLAESPMKRVIKLVFLAPSHLWRSSAESMSTREQLLKARLGMQALADELKNIAKARKLAEVSRSHFNEIKKAYEPFGKNDLVPKVRRPWMSSQTPPELKW